MYVPPPPPPPIPPPPTNKPSPLVPLLVFGAIGLMTLVAAIAAGFMAYVSMRDRADHPPASGQPVVEKPREPEPAPAFVEPEPQKPPERESPPARRATAEVERRPARPAPRGTVGSRLGEAPPGDLPPAPRRPLMVGGNIPAPTKIRNVNPVYPQIAVSARVQGTVVIEATIGPDGKIQDTKVLRSIPLLDQAALDAVRQWEYTPTLLNGEPVPVIMTVTVRFSLQ